MYIASSWNHLLADWSHILLMQHMPSLSVSTEITVKSEENCGKPSWDLVGPSFKTYGSDILNGRLLENMRNCASHSQFKTLRAHHLSLVHSGNWNRPSESQEIGQHISEFIFEYRRTTQNFHAERWTTIRFQSWSSNGRSLAKRAEHINSRVREKTWESPFGSQNILTIWQTNMKINEHQPFGLKVFLLKSVI